MCLRFVLEAKTSSDRQRHKSSEEGATFCPRWGDPPKESKGEHIDIIEVWKLTTTLPTMLHGSLGWHGASDFGRTWNPKTTVRTKLGFPP